MIPLSYTNTSLSQINRFIPSLSHQVVRFASGGSRWKFWSKSKESVDDVEAEPLSDVDMFNQQQETFRREAAMEAVQLKRNKSRLSASHRQMIRGQAPNVGVRFQYSRHHHSQEYKRAMLGQYGSRETGVDPAICWPTDQHLHLAGEWEKLYQEKPLSEQLKDVQDNIVKRREDRIAREKAVDDGLARMETQIKQWRSRVSSRNQQAEKERHRREKILAELREEFGYNVNPNDNYMKERIAEREKAILKEEKEAKKAAKKQKFTEKQSS